VLALLSMTAFACSGPAPSGDGSAEPASRRSTRRIEAPADCARGLDDLFSAAQRGDVEMVRACLDDGVELEARDRNWRTPLAAAALAGRAEVVAQLLDAGARVVPAGGGPWPLELAVRNGHVEVVRLLLDAGAPIESSDDESLLAEAAELSSPETALLLLEYGADPRADGGESLARAASRCDERLVGALLAAGAEAEAGRPGRRPIDVAKQRGERCATVFDLLEVHSIEMTGRPPEPPSGPAWQPPATREWPASPQRPPLQ